MKISVAGQSRASDDGGANQEHYVIIRTGPLQIAALFLARHVAQLSLGAALRDETWLSMIMQIDLALCGGPETTIVGASMLGDEAIVFGAGDSRAYLVPLHGPTRIVTDDASKARLGSGNARPVVHRVELARRDTLVLTSDGAWTPLGTRGIDRVRSAVMKDVTEVCEAIVDAAGRRGRMDDQTCVAVRRA